MNSYDTIIIGAGIGGLVSAALLVAAGKHVLLLEQHHGVGGCAATFSHRGFRFDAGATVGCGFHTDGPMQWLAERLNISWPVLPLPVAWEYCDGNTSISLDPERRSLIKQFPATESFWGEQADVADRLWDLSEILLALYNRGRLQQAASFARLLPVKVITPKILQLASMSTDRWLQKHDLHKDEEFCRFIDAQLLISAQTIASSCNALFAAMALDLPRKSPCSIIGGMGTVAETLCKTIIKLGGKVRLGEKVLSFAIYKGRISEVLSDKGRYRAREIIFNGSSEGLVSLLDKRVSLSRQTSNRTSWGAFILHLGVEQNVLNHLKSPHIQLVREGCTKLAEGASLFLSASHPSDTTRAPTGKVPITISTHTSVHPWWEAQQKGKEFYRAMKWQYTETILELLERHIKGVRDSINICISGTPLTYARYTGRHLGLVGGYAQERLLPPRQQLFGLKNCSLVGDSIFPGQSIAAVTVGAIIVIDRLLRRL